MRRTDIQLRLAFMSDFHAEIEDDIDRALAMIDDALDPDLGVDHIIIGGDIVDRAQQELLEQLADGLKRRKCLDRATVVPGNHDVFPVSKRDIGSSIIGYLGGVFGPTPTARYEEFCRLFAGCRGKRGGKRLVRGEDYPFGRILGKNVVLVALDSTRNGKYDPREWAAGELQEEDIEATGEFFAEHAGARHKLVVMHHSPWEPLDSAEDPRFPMGMIEPDNKTAVAWLAGTGASLVLCGHFHALSGVEKRKRLGKNLDGFMAGVSGGADNDEDDDVQRYHVLDLLSNGRYTVSERAFEREELE